MKTTLKLKISLSFILSFVLSTTLSAQENDQKPNILILIGDDIDRDTLGPWGGQAITPHLDQLAMDGIRLDKVYANVAMCAPFRQELYSGRSVWRTRAMPNHSRSKPETKSLPHYLRPLGYKVGLVGKSHVGPKEAYPFDRLGEIPKRQNANPKALALSRKYVQSAREANQSFCLVIAAHDGHSPYTTGDPSQYDPAKFVLPKDSIDTPNYRENLAKHFAEVTNLDALLGDLRKMLKEEKVDQNTLVLFCSEQGNAFPFSKWTCFDDGLSSGIVAALPGVIPAGKKLDQLVWISDFVPTLIEAAGGTVSEKDFDGRSQWSNFNGDNNVVHNYAYGAFTNCNIIANRDRIFPIRSIRDKRYTLIWSPRAGEDITSNTTLTQALNWIHAGERTPNPPTTTGSWLLRSWETKSKTHAIIIKRLHHRPEWALYDRNSDPEELTNLVDDPKLKPVLSKLKGELKNWLKKWDDEDPVKTEKGFVKKNSRKKK